VARWSRPARSLVRPRRFPPHVVAVLLAGFIAAGLGVAAHLGHLLPGVRSDSVALRFQTRGAQPTDELLVVAVDDLTFSDLGEQWPFPRSLHAKAIDRLRAAGAGTIVYDVQFTEATTEREDLALYDAVDRAGNVILATSETDGQGRTNVLGGDENLAAAGAEAAASNLPTGPGGVFERFTARAVGIDTLAVAASRRAGGPRLEPSDFERGGAWIDYRGGPGTIDTVSFSDLVDGEVDPALVRDRIVVVGASAPALQDVHATPAADDQVMSGPEIQANAIWSAIHRLPLRTVPWWADILTILALGLAPAIVALRARPLAVALVAPLLGLLWLGSAQLVFGAGWMVDVVWPLAALVMGTTGTVAGRYLAELGERRRVSIYNELLERRVRERTEELRDTQLEVVRRLALAAESRDGDTGAHIERMSRLCERLALAAGWSEAKAELMRHASALHDVGKIGIPDRVLLKPGRLDDPEWTVMKSHAEKGAVLLSDSRSDLLQLAEVIARTHHERWDGSGYPRGLAGEEIPLAGRICAICDVFDALVSPRPYKDPWAVKSALAEIRSQSGHQFDPDLVDIFVELDLHSAAPSQWPVQDPAPVA
jgi:CHASE2 domain-containing sensor protein